MKNLLVFIFLFTLATQSCFAQGKLNSSTFKRTTATILFSSIGGGVLGLSTLSFYGKPQEHTDNITTGVLIGFLAGVGYVFYDNYQQPQAGFSQFENKKALTKDFILPLMSFNYEW